MSDLKPPRPIRLRFQLLAFSIIRTVVTTGHRMIYPFRTVIARGLGVDLATIDQAIAIRSGLGVLGPVFGSIADIRGRKFGMLLGLGLFASAMLLVVLWPTYAALFTALMLAGAGKIIFDSAVQAYLGDRVHYQQRGRAIALVEMSWSWAFLFGMPIAGWLIAANGWSAPFPLIAGLAVLGGVVLWRMIPSDSIQAGSRPSLRGGLRVILSSPPAIAALLVSMLISVSNEAVTIIFGEWLENAFALQVAALGIAATVIGVAELSGEGLVATVADRLGKRRSVGLGIGGSVLTSVTLPILGHSLVGALVGLFLFFITFEFALVTTISLMTELTPDARATLMAGNLAVQSIGRAAGALLGPALFASGMAANSIVAVICNVIALATLVFFVRENHAQAHD